MQSFSYPILLDKLNKKSTFKPNFNRRKTCKSFVELKYMIPKKNVETIFFYEFFKMNHSLNNLSVYALAQLIYVGGGWYVGYLIASLLKSIH